MIHPVEIGNHSIGPGHPCFIIAEAGVNHNGNINLAHRLIDAAAKARANAVKFQSFVAEDLVTREAPKVNYQVKTTGQEGSQFEMLKSLELSMEEQAELKAHCEELDLIYLCTPYEVRSVDMLDRLDVAAFKFASTDITNIPLLRYAAGKKRPVLLSTGMSNLGELEEAMCTLWKGGLDKNIVLLHCTSEYPAPIKELNLKAMITMMRAFSCPAGFSDHTTGIKAAQWAAAMGACVIEKHFTLDRNMKGPDHQSSLEPDALIALVNEIRHVEAALGDGIKRPMPSELRNKPLMQKSVVAYRAIEKGEVITADHLTVKRPGFGLSPSWFDRLLGNRALVNIAEGDIITIGSIEWIDQT